MVQLDEVLFLPSGWFALSAGNQRVPGVVVPSLSAGLGLVGQGEVASLVGRLRPGFRVVDVDVEGLRGQAIADEITAWCQSRGLWFLQRPSGGAVGRTHVFVAIGEDLDALSECVAGLRVRVSFPAPVFEGKPVQAGFPFFKIDALVKSFRAMAR